MERSNEPLKPARVSVIAPQPAIMLNYTKQATPVPNLPRASSREEEPAPTVEQETTAV